MKHTSKRQSIAIVALTAAGALCAHAAVLDIAVNGGFETGDTSGWTYFPTAGSAFAVTGDSDTGAFAAELFNNSPTSAAVIKQANLAAGFLTPGATITVSFAAKESTAAGGVLFAELFSEIDGGGTSKSEILGGAPLFANPVSGPYSQYWFTTTLGPDVSGGVTLQLTATTGAAGGSTAVAFYDSVSIVTDVIPEPASTSLLGLAGLLLCMRRRHR